jgi:tetratricopeptide (TPR) repeat protein
MTEVLTPVEVFCSYAHEDEVWRKKLETHLSLLRRQGLVSFWHDRLITPGTDWAKAIDPHLETASVILLLVSSDFFASDYCYGIEMKQALERHKAGEARIIPIMVRPVDWKDAPFAHLQALPTDAKPISARRNQDTALTDVAAGIRRAIVEDLPQLSASASRAALPKIWNIPYPRNPFFLGRDAELSQVRHHLLAGQTTALSQPQAISGLGGIGKTQLALAYAYRYHQDYTVAWWVRAESTETLNSSYIALAERLRLPEREAKEPNIIVQAIKTWLQIHRDWLLILDNADELALLSDFLPPSVGGHLLLTTRATATGRLAQRLEIDTLLPEYGALFLLRRAALLAPDAELSQASQEEQKQALQISQELGGLPLALDQAGAYLEETGIDLASYWQVYQQHRTNLLQRRGGQVNDHPASVATTWSLSFQKIEKKSPAAADLLRLCAYLVPHTIPEEILTAGASLLGPVLAPVAADAFLLNQAIETLRAYSLLRRDPKEKILLVHPLVQAVLQDTEEEAEKHNWAERTMLAVNMAFPHAKDSPWPQCERLLPHALQVAQYIERYQFISEEAGHLLYKIASYLLRRARYAKAESFYQRALQIREQHLGPEHSHVADTLDGLARLYFEQGRYIEAETLSLRELQMREQTLEPEHLSMTSPLLNLAYIYRAQREYEKAEPMFLRAIWIFEHASGADDTWVAISLNNLANLYRKQKKYDKAAPLYQRAQKIWEQRPQMSDFSHRLATLYADQGKYEEAERWYQHTLQIWEQKLGSEHISVSYPLNNLANLYKKQREYEKAEVLFQRALRIREQVLGSEHPHVAAPLNSLARLYYDQGRHTEAGQFYQRALRVQEQGLGPRHPETTETRTCLIALLHEMGQHEEADRLEAAQPEP